MSSRPGAGYDHVALELFWKLLVQLYLGKDNLKASLGAFVFEGCCKASISRTCQSLTTGWLVVFLGTEKSSLVLISLSKSAAKSWDVAPSAPAGLDFLHEDGL